MASKLLFSISFSNTIEISFSFDAIRKRAQAQCPVDFVWWMDNVLFISECFTIIVCSDRAYPIIIGVPVNCLTNKMGRCFDIYVYIWSLLLDRPRSDFYLQSNTMMGKITYYYIYSYLGYRIAGTQTYSYVLQNGAWLDGFSPGNIV